MFKRNNRPLTMIKALTVILLTVGLGLTFSCKKAATVSSGQRYVVLSPEVAEIIALLEGTGNIVGITEECNFPEQYSGKTVVGKFGALDKEHIIALKPSAVFASSLEQQAISSELEKLGIKVVSVYPKTIDEMLQGIITVGNAIGKTDRALFVADSLRRELDAIKKQTEGKARPKVYLEIYREPLMSVSDQSFVGELIELAGGDNIFANLERDYSRIKAEDVIKANPDIIICYSQDSLENISKRMGWQDIPAIHNKRIYFESDLNPDWLLRAGPRCVLGVKRLQEIIYNEK